MLTPSPKSFISIPHSGITSGDPKELFYPPLEASTSQQAIIVYEQNVFVLEKLKLFF